MIQKNSRTIKIYETDSHCREFTAEVLACAAAENGYEIILDQTAFFPEGGGQMCDTGMLGGCRVKSVYEKEGVIAHLADAPLEEGARVSGVIDWAARFDRMQGHSGEHIVSGLIHGRFGLNNVGFHLGSTDITLDFDGMLTRDELDEIEAAANRVVWQNLPILAEYPDEETLRDLPYRSKLELTENVRIVTIPGVDMCACCAPHVRSTGEIGLIKLTECIRYKGGVRIHMLCGERALADYAAKYAQAAAIGTRLSCKNNELNEAVLRLEDELARQKQENMGLKKELILRTAEALPQTCGNLVLFNAVPDKSLLRDFANAALPRCTKVCAVFFGDDQHGWQYVLASAEINLRDFAKGFNAALQGKGGGKPDMISGSLAASQAEIERYLAEN